MNPPPPGLSGHEDLHNEMYGWARDLFPFCRSLTGNGVRDTLTYLQKIIPGLRMLEVPSGTRAFDWTVPEEWNIRDAFVADESGTRVIDFRASNLHVLGYSEPVDAVMTLEELQPHLHSIPAQPDAIPFVTSPYKRCWGFCLAHRARERLKPGIYHVRIDSTLAPGSMTYGECLLPGLEEKEILLSTYVCHPSMANNEISGPVVTAALTRWLSGLENRRFSYRILFLPETIGSIVYLSHHLEAMKKNTVAGFVVTCVGDDRTYSLLASRLGDTLADRVARCILRHHHPGFASYSFLERGSDERQYCSPGVDLPVASIMRSKYLAYPEYHTSLDNLDLISPAGLGGAYQAYVKCLRALEANRSYRAVFPCEPQLGKRGLYPTCSTGDPGKAIYTMLNFLAYCDGNHDLIAISERLNAPVEELIPIQMRLLEAGVITLASETP